MDNTSTAGEWIVQPGTDVYGTDDKKIGSVDDIQGEYLVVHKGFFFPKDHYIPFSAIASHTDDRINLNVSADEASAMDWDQAPASTTTTDTYAANDYDAASVPGTTATDGYSTGATETVATGTTAGYATDTASGYVADATDVNDSDATGTNAAAPGAPFEHRTSGSTPHSDDDGDIRVPVVEEELSATTRGVERGAVRVQTNVTEREQTLDVPVTEERVHVERRTVDRPADAADISANGGVIDVPVYGEEVDMQKQARVVEEVEISKDAVQETRQVSGTVRREDVEVIDDTVTTDGTRTDSNRSRS